MKHVEFLEHFREVTRIVLALYTWRDFFEVTLLAGLIYLFLTWLNKDKSSYPVLFFHIYAGLTIIAYYAQLAVLSTILLISAPIAIMLLILMHQQSLQKNLIVAKIIKPPAHHDFAWLDELVRTCLSVLNKHKELICLIERSDNLKTLLTAPYYFNADIKKELLEILVDHVNTAAGQMLWIEQTGKLIAINARLGMPVDVQWFTSPLDAQQAWKQDAVFLSTKTDAIVIRVCVNSRLFTCIAQGKIVEDLSAWQMLALLKKYLAKSPTIQKDTYHHAQPQHNFTKQELT